MATGNMLEHVNLRSEGYFRALYVPLGGSKTRMENTPYKSIKFYISMFSHKPPCMPLCFGTTVIILPEVAGDFSYFLASAATTFSLLTSAAATFSSFLASATRASSSTFSSCLALFFHFLFFFFNFFFFIRLSFQPGWVM